MPSTSIHAENGLPVSCRGLEMLVGTLLLTLVLAAGTGCFWLAAPKVGPLTRTAGQLSPIEWKRALVKSMSTVAAVAIQLCTFRAPSPFNVRLRSRKASCSGASGWHVSEEIASI